MTVPIWVALVAALVAGLFGFSYGGALCLRMAKEGRFSDKGVVSRKQSIAEVTRLCREYHRIHLEEGLSNTDIRQQVFTHLDKGQQTVLMLEICSKLSDEDLENLRRMGRQAGLPPAAVDRQVQRVARMAGLSAPTRVMDLDPD